MRVSKRQNASRKNDQVLKNPFSAAASSLSFVLKINPGAAIVISASIIAVYFVAAVSAIIISQNLSSQTQQSSALIVLLIVLGVYFSQGYGWLLCILLFKQSRDKKRIKIRQIVKDSVQHLESFFALFILQLFFISFVAFFLLKLTVVLGSALQVGILVVILGLMLLMFLPKVALVAHIIVYEDKKLLDSIKRGLGLSRGQTVELVGSLSAQSLMFGVSLVALAGSTGSIDERYRHYVSLEHAGKKPTSKTHIINWIFTYVWVGILCILGIFVFQHYTHKPIMVPIINQRTTENYCYLDTQQAGYTCSQSKEKCLEIKACRESLEVRNELDGLMNSEDFN